MALAGFLFWLLGDEAIVSKPELQTAILIAFGLAGFTTMVWIWLMLLPGGLSERLTARLERIPRLGHSVA